MNNDLKLYKDNEKSEALNFLVNDILNNIDTKNIGIEDDIDRKHADNIVRNIISNIIIKSYGVNIPMMANYISVQNNFHQIYEKHILDYLKYCGISAEITYVQPSQITMSYIINESKKDSFKPFISFNPLVKWDKLEYSDDKNKNIMNPINSLEYAVLSLNNINNLDFLEHVYINDYDVYSKIKRAIEDGKNIQVNLRLLPSCDYNAILSTIYLLHKYF